MQPVFRQRLFATTLLVSAVTLAQPAYAQNTETNVSEETADVGDPAARLCAENPDAPQCAAQGQAIVVTGSRIASPTLTSASPLQIVDAQDIDEAGVVNLQEVLLENPAFGAPAISRTNSGFANNSAGVATIDLRNLGTARTLVLVNGRRFTPGIPGTSSVDLNTIPTQFIERVDILTGGASSIYGSDAVAGVVNIVYKDDFEGLELSGQLGISERGDDTRKQANLLMGSNFGDGRGNIAVYLGYSDEGAVFSRNRENLGAELDQISLFRLTGDPNDFFTPFRPFRSGFAPQGTFFLDPSATAPITRTFNPCSGAITTTNTNAVDNCAATGFNRSAFRTIAIPTERYLMALRGNYEITDSIGAFVEGTFAKTSTRTQLEPFPQSSSGPGSPYQATGGRFDIEQDIAFTGTGPLPNPATNPGVVACNDVTRVCRVRNPLLPVAFYNLAADTVSSNGVVVNAVGPNGLRDIGFQQRTAYLGPRGAAADRNTFRILAGLEGTVFGDWRWDVFYSYGETTESQTSGGQVNNANFREALNVIPDINDVDGDGDISEPICANAEARRTGCVPLNIFGANLASPAAIAYVSAPASRNTLTSQKLAGANLSGTLFDGWAGPIGAAVGVEYRKDFSRAENDVLTQIGGNGGNALPNVEGSFDVVEGYVELAVPLISDQPFFHLLEARGAVRVSDYSTVGTTYSYNAGLEWAPVPDVRFRAVYARATRAPNIGELFTPPSQTFPPGLADPCVGVGPTGGGVLGDRCRADPGVANNITQNGVFTLNQADLQGTGGFIPGNPNLEEEKGTSYTLGVVVNPTSINWLRNFAFTADYFNIKIDNVITVIPFQFILDQCYGGEESFCPRITRITQNEGPNSAGFIQNINTSTLNFGNLKTEGIDLTASWRQNLEDWGLAGTLNARVTYTHLFKLEILQIGDILNPIDGEYGASRNKAFGTLAYQLGDWGLTLRGTYVGPAFADDQFLSAFGLEPEDPASKVGAEFLADAQVRFTPGDNYEFYFGVDNLFDNAPPPIISGLPGSNTGTETNASTYDPIGRRFYAGARLKF